MACCDSVARYPGHESPADRFDVFGRDIPSALRTPLTVWFPARSEPFKGTADAIAAATLLRNIYGDRLQVTAFGSHAD